MHLQNEEFMTLWIFVIQFLSAQIFYGCSLINQMLIVSMDSEWQNFLYD